MSGLLPPPPSGDAYLTGLVGFLNGEFGRLEPMILGVRHDGTDLHLRFRAALATPWVQVHVQSTDAGEGGAAYDAANYTSSTEVDCRTSRIQNVTVTDLYGTRYYVWLIPVLYDGAGTKILYDGEGTSPDNMVFFDLGAL